MADYATRLQMAQDPAMFTRAVPGIFAFVMDNLTTPDPGDNAPVADRIAWNERRGNASALHENLRGYFSGDQTAYIYAVLYDISLWSGSPLADMWAQGGGVNGGADAISDEDLSATLHALWDVTHGY